jgi:hypothetical protein
MFKGMNGVQLVAITGAVTLLFSCLGRFLMMKTEDGEYFFAVLLATSLLGAAIVLPLFLVGWF